MGKHVRGIPNRSGEFLLISCVAVLALILYVCIAETRTSAQSAVAQTATTPLNPDWQKVAGGKMAFDAASVKQNKSGLPPSGDMPKSNFPLGPGDHFSSGKAKTKSVEASCPM
jgi:hypothetical protein